MLPNFLSSVTFSDGVDEGEVKFESDSYTPGETAVFFIRDSSLATSQTCVGTWANISSSVDKFVDWNVATGSPLENDYSLNANCNFDTSDPSNTPVIWLRNPVPQLTVNNVPALIFAHSEGQIIFQLQQVINASSTVEIIFHHDVVDSHIARAKVTSQSDPNGEWVEISEVASESAASPNPVSNLFRGEIGVSSDESSKAIGDNELYASAGDSLEVTYFDETGTTPINSDVANLDVPVPTPTPKIEPSATPTPSVSPSPIATSTPTVVPTPTPQICEFSGTTEAVIKGNINSSGEKIYHTPSSPSYNQVVIDESKGERYFCTVVEAENAGWRLPANQIPTPTPVPTTSTVAVVVLAAAFFILLTWRLWSRANSKAI